MFITYDIILVLTALLLSFAGTGAAYAALKRLQVLDNPNTRSNHSVPTPRGGGLGIVATLAALLVVVGVPVAVLVGLVLLAAVSFLDDLRSLPARYRFAAQVIAVTWVMLTQESRIWPELLPQVVEYALIGLAWLWFINLFNFMDGSDGLAGSEGVCIAFGVAIVSLAHPLSLFGLIVGASILGFLPWNWHRAKIFMGDVGSIPLGFMLGYLLLQLAFNGYLIAALILPAVFLVDATFTLFRRLTKGERIFEAHSQHGYQRAIRAGLAHDEVAREVIAINMILLILALTSIAYPLYSVLLAYALTAGLIFGRFYRYRSNQEEVGA